MSLEVRCPWKWHPQDLQKTFQFLAVCRLPVSQYREGMIFQVFPDDLKVHIKEQRLKSATEYVSTADRYRNAHKSEKTNNRRKKLFNRFDKSDQKDKPRGAASLGDDKKFGQSTGNNSQCP